MTFREAFPILRDAILSVCFMHFESIAHRDIKMQNIFELSDNSYVTADFGEGINLKFKEQYGKQVDFSVNHTQGWDLAGTSIYMDPLIHKVYLRYL